MQDLMEITTWPKQQCIYYLVTSNSLLVSVCATGNAGIGLSTTPGTECNYWIRIGEFGRCVIHPGDHEGISVPTPDILNENQFRTFWLSWHDGQISLGRYGENTAILSYLYRASHLNYITFVTTGNNLQSVKWRFELPPLLPQITLKPVSDGKPHWVEAGDQLPDGAVIGGFEKEVLYIIRSKHRQSLIPGKFVPSEGLGYISWNGQDHEKSTFEVLCGFDCMWVPSYEDQIPKGAVVGGYTENMHEPLYVGRISHEGYLIPGKVQPSQNGCSVSFQGSEIEKRFYEILVEPFTNKHCVNSTYLGVDIDDYHHEQYQQ